MSINDRQQQLIDELDRNVILLASAGTGKTDTLSRRIANIIGKGRAKPTEILCITFTNKACKEMKERIEKIVESSAKDITIKTFHSFCFDMIKQEAKKRTDIFTDFIVFDEDEGEKIYLKVSDSQLEEARFIFEEVKALEERTGSANNICILTRDNKYNIGLSESLKYLIKYDAVNFEFILVDQYKFFRRQEIKDVIAFLKLIGNRYDSLSLNRIVKRLPTNIGDRTLETIESKEYKRLGIALSDFIDNNVTAYGEKYSLLINEFEKSNIVVFDVESTGIYVTEDEIIQIAAIRIDNKGQVIDRFERFLKNKKSVKNSEHVHGYSDKFLREKGEEKEVVFKDFLNFSEDAVIVGHNVQYDINILTSELARLKLGKPKFKAFYDTLDIYRRFYPNLANHKLETLSRVFETENKPSHDAMDDILATKDLLVKVLETVFVSGAQQNTFPSYRALRENNLEEEKRTFYVAITRAKKRLYITCHTEGSFNRKNNRSCFIDFIPAKYICNK